MKINCISCGYKFDLGDAYEDFTGPVKCYICGATLEIKTEDGKLKAIAVKTVATGGRRMAR